MRKDKQGKRMFSLYDCPKYADIIGFLVQFAAANGSCALTNAGALAIRRSPDYEKWKQSPNYKKWKEKNGANE